MKNPLLRRLPPILLIGSLSMLFAEVFSGASQTWFVEIWGLFLTFPLYLGHVLFFLYIAFRLKKMSLSQLYLFGVIFGMYESWITKVLWAGYMDSAGPGLGTFLGIAVVEFPILVFFWHPVMSFIVPVLTYESLTGYAHIEHASILKKSRRKTAVIVIFSVLVSTFAANGNGFDLISSNLSVVGSWLIVFTLFFLSRRADLREFKFKKIGLIVLSVYLVVLYFVTFFFLLPERIPETFIPYITIILFYVFTVISILRTKRTEMKFTSLDDDHYSFRDIVIFAGITVVGTNLACLVSSAGYVLLIATYFSLVILGTLIFIFTIYLNEIKGLINQEDMLRR